MSPKKLDLSGQNQGQTVDLSQGPKKKKKVVPSTASRKNGSSSPEKEPGFFGKMGAAIKKNRALQVVLIILGVFCVAALTYGAQQMFFSQEPEEEEIVVEQPVEEEEINPLARRTDGVIVESETEANKYPVAIMIENLSVVRPQSGLSVANIVYETLAEGGITRFMAIFAGDTSQEIHPVRSARPYFLEWVQEYKALYGHAGGSPQALEAISGLEINDLDGLSSDGKYFWRGPGSAPHNLYTSSTLIERAVRDKGLKEIEADFQPWKFLDEEPSQSDLPEEEMVLNVNFSNGSYNVMYEYDREENCYKRFHVNDPHTDRISGEQLCPRNVIVQVVPPATPAGEKGRISLDVTGEGEAAIYRDGEEVKGTWKKENRDARTLYFDENGDEIELARGQIWIEILPSDKTYEYEID